MGLANPEAPVEVDAGATLRWRRRTAPAATLRRGFGKALGEHLQRGDRRCLRRLGHVRHVAGERGRVEQWRGNQSIHELVGADARRSVDQSRDGRSGHGVEDTAASAA